MRKHKENFALSVVFSLILSSFSYTAPACMNAEVVYTETFDDYSADDQANSPEVCWGGSFSIASPSGTPLCMDGCSMRINYLSEEPVIGIDLQGYADGSLSYIYYQWDSASCVTEQKTESFGTLDCEQSYGFSAIQYHSAIQQCIDVVIPLTDDSINYIRWRKSGSSGTAIWIDAIVVQASGQGQQCVDSFDEDFGTSFESGSVCSIWPDKWEVCEGYGPYITSLGPCGGAYDYVLNFGYGYPYSTTETICINLVGAAAPSLKYYYTWDGFSYTSPRIEISIDNGDSWTDLVSSHENTGGACIECCEDLNAYTGYEIKLRFASHSTSSDYHAYFDDIRVYRNDPCSQYTATPTSTPTPLTTDTLTPMLTASPSLSSTMTAAVSPTSSSSSSPTKSPTISPTLTVPPTSIPTDAATEPPTLAPTKSPTDVPFHTPSHTDTPQNTPTTTVSPTLPPIPTLSRGGFCLLILILGSPMLYRSIRKP